MDPVGSDVVTADEPAAQAAGTTVTRGGGGLPLTGTDVAQLLVAGIVVLGIGIALTATSRRQRAGA